MILVDTSIWIDHFRHSDMELRRIIEDDFRDVGCKQLFDHIGSHDFTEFQTSWSDRSCHLVVSKELTHQFRAVASICCSPWWADFFMRPRSKSIAQGCCCEPRRSSSSSKQFCGAAPQLPVWGACASAVLSVAGRFSGTWPAKQILSRANYAGILEAERAKVLVSMRN